MTDIFDEKTHQSLQRAYFDLTSIKTIKIRKFNKPEDLKKTCSIEDETEAQTLFESLSLSSKDLVPLRTFAKVTFPHLLHNLSMITIEIPIKIR